MIDVLVRLPDLRKLTLRIYPAIAYPGKYYIRSTKLEVYIILQRRSSNMKFKINFKADLTPEKKELLDLHFAGTLRCMGIEPEDLTITLREKLDPIPAAECKEIKNVLCID
jgi:hypothetical protein